MGNRRDIRGTLLGGGEWGVGVSRAGHKEEPRIEEPGSPRLVPLPTPSMGPGLPRRTARGGGPRLRWLECSQHPPTLGGLCGSLPTQGPGSQCPSLGQGTPRPSESFHGLSGIHKCGSLRRRRWFNKLCRWRCWPPTTFSQRGPWALGARPRCPPPLHPSVRFRGDRRAGEEAEAVSALSRALHRQRYHRAARVHALPAHLGGAGRGLSGAGAGREGEPAGGCGGTGPARSPGPCAPS